MCISASPCAAELSPASPSQAHGFPGSPSSPSSYPLPWTIPMTMGEMATPRSPLQSDSEGSTSSLELGSGVAGIALGPSGTLTPPPATAQEAVKCRWQHCGLWLASLDALALHVTLAHASAGRGGLFYCGWEGCSRGHRGFNARYKMLVHVRTHTNERPHRCSRCEKSFSRAENLKIHARSHTGERPYTCPVPGCNKAYSNSSDRFKHTRTHAVDKPYVCKVEGCPKRYTDPSSLRKHVKTYRHFPSGSSAASDHDSPQGSPGGSAHSAPGSERDSHSPHGSHSPGSPSSDEEGRSLSAFRPMPPALERPPLPGECRGIPIKKAISARVRAVRHQDVIGSAGGRAWAGGSVWVGSSSPGSLSLSPSSSPSPSPSGGSLPTPADWFSAAAAAAAAAPLYSSPVNSPSWAWGSVGVGMPVLSLWDFPQTAGPAQAHSAPHAPSPLRHEDAAVPLPLSAQASMQAAPLDLTIARN